MSSLPIGAMEKVRKAVERTLEECRREEEGPHTFFRHTSRSYEDVKPCRSRLKRKLPSFNVPSYEEIKSQSGTEE